MDLKKAREIIKANLKACCAEIQNWHIIGTLEDGIVRKVSEEYCEGDPRLAELEVNRLAREFVIGN